MPYILDGAQIEEQGPLLKMKTELNEEREERIAMEIIVDAYGPEEQAMGWYYYLKDTVEFPFSAVCFAARSISPLKIKELFAK